MDRRDDATGLYVHSSEFEIAASSNMDNRLHYAVVCVLIKQLLEGIYIMAMMVNL